MKVKILLISIIILSDLVISCHQDEEELPNPFTDKRDGHQYQWVKIGDQIWMAENLAYLPFFIQYRPGSDLDLRCFVYGYEGNEFSEAKASPNFKTYGVLYNWPAAMNGENSSSKSPSGVQGICPEGWHLPSDAEWVILEDYLIHVGYDMGNSSGKNIVKSLALKEGWLESSRYGAAGSTDHPQIRNITGFSAKPGGFCDNLGHFEQAGMTGCWWSATVYGGTEAWCRHIYYNNSYINRFSNKRGNSFSVRCIKD